MTRRGSGDDPHADPELEAIAAEEAAGLRFLPGRFEWLSLDDLEPHPANPNEGDVGAISESIDATGFYGLLLVQDARYAPNGKARILAGEHRWRSLSQKGARRAPCWVMDVDDATARRILLDNRFTRLGRDIPDATSRLLREIAADPGGLAGVPYDADDIAALEAEVDRGMSDALAAATRDAPPPAQQQSGPIRPHTTCPNCGHRFPLGTPS